ncbi:MAG: DUF6732 family protein [Pseudomonadota bacterium]
MRYLFFTLCVFSFSTPALAHWGHVGELAGHGHWIAVGAAAGAAALAAWLARPGKDKKADEELADETEDGEVGETA